MNTEQKEAPVDAQNDETIKELLANDTGKREPSKPVAKFISLVAIAWSLFQLWFASPLPFKATVWAKNMGLDINFAIDDAKARSIHLAFAIFLCFLLYPFSKRSSRTKIPYIDWILAVTGGFCAAYFFLFYNEFSLRQGSPIMQDIIIGIFGLSFLLLATVRTLGLPLMVIAILFLAFNLAGPHLPEIFAHNRNALSTIMNHQWITTEGVYGVALSVSTKFVFLFVLFGTLLDRAGAGNYFIKTAFAYLGHFRGGPAKAAVVGSACSGLISGSSIANVVTTGTFTIPMMKRVGFAPEKAGAVEVASSVNGQIMPPVMGAAAFLMVEYVGVSYLEVIKSAFIPAVISYIALFYIVHLEAIKMNMPTLEPANKLNPVYVTLLKALTNVVIMVAVFTGLYYGVDWLKSKVAHPMLYVMIGMAVVYLLALKRAASFPDLEMDDPNAPVSVMPDAKKTINTGWHFFIPVVVLIWCIMVERFSPATSAYWGVITLIVILLTQKVLIALLRGEKSQLKALFIESIKDLFVSFELAAKNMIAIAIATATAGIIVGVVSLTGVGSVFSDIVETISGGNILIMLIMVAVLSLVLGVGLPTTANYIVVSSLLAVVIVEVGRSNGLVIPLIAVHMFVFYFGIMADVTPPVGLASFAAAAISGGAPIRTGIVAFFYSLRTAILPFLFIFNTDLLLINVDFYHAILVFFVSVVAILLFSAATQGYFFDKLKFYEIGLLLFLALAFFRPGLFVNMISPTLVDVPLQQYESLIKDMPEGSKVRLKVMTDDGFEEKQTYVEFVSKGSLASDVFKNYGIELDSDVTEKGILVTGVEFASTAEKDGFDVFYDQHVTSIQKSNIDAIAKEWLYVLLLPVTCLIAWQQKRRRKKRIASGLC